MPSSYHAEFHELTRIERFRCKTTTSARVLTLNTLSALHRDSQHRLVRRKYAESTPKNGTQIVNISPVVSKWSLPAASIHIYVGDNHCARAGVRRPMGLEEANPRYGTFCIHERGWKGARISEQVPLRAPIGYSAVTIPELTPRGRARRARQGKGIGAVVVLPIRGA